MKTKEEIIVRSKRDLYEHFDARIKRIEDKMEEMCAIEDKPKSEKK